MVRGHKNLNLTITVGLMEGAYFVGRKELLQWINSFLKLNYDRIEQVCTGAAHCQLMDSMYPNMVPLHKVNFSAKFEHEYIKNFKILQEVFTKLNIAKVIDINKLIRGKQQDNLEFLQWMRRYWDMHFPPNTEYDALGRRNTAMRMYDQDKKVC